MDFISNAVGYIGVVIVLSVVYSLVKEIRVILKSNPDVQSKYGKNCWAVVTGGTDGIGKGFVEVSLLQNNMIGTVQVGCQYCHRGKECREGQSGREGVEIYAQQ